jgi:fatty acid desaturase
LNLKHDRYFLAVYLLQTAMLVSACVLIPMGFADSILRFTAIPLISILMFRSFSFMHDAVHGAVTKNRRVDDLLGIVSGALCLLSYDSWKQAHMEHHRWSGNLDKDPVMAMIKTFPKFPRPLRALLSFGWKCWLPALSFLQHTVFWSITVQHVLRKPQTAFQWLSAVLPVAFWATLLWVVPVHATVSILLPAVALYLLGTELINAPHHLGLPYNRGETRLPPWEQHSTARSCAYPRWISKWIVLNFNYHIEHHMYPNAPWYHLDKLHEAVKAELGDRYNTDPRFSWLLRNRKEELGTVFGSSQVESDRAPEMKAA